MIKKIWLLVLTIAFIIVLFSFYLAFGRKINRAIYPSIVYSIDSNSLPIEIQWVQVVTDPIHGKPIGNDEKIVVQSGEKYLFGFDNQTGKVLWQYEATSSFLVGQHIALTDELVIGVTNRLDLFALDIDTGYKVWNEIISEPLISSPDILVIDDNVILAQRNMGGGTYIATYKVIDSGLRKEMSFSFPRNDFSSIIACPNIKAEINQDPADVCLIFYDKIFVMDSFQSINLDEIQAPFSVAGDPLYIDGIIFSRSSKASNTASVQAFDARENNYHVLFATCDEQKQPYPTSSYQSGVLISNGCDEVYVVSTEGLYKKPAWIFHSPLSTRSSFVTVEGKFGYFLNDNAEVVGIDLENGHIVGKLMLEPNYLNNDRFNSNSIYVIENVLYVIVDEINIIAFSQ